MEQIPSILPVLPIRNAVLFPAVSMPLVIGRDRSIRAVEKAEKAGGLLIVVAQKIITPGDPTAEDLYHIGTLCRIDSVISTDSGSRQIVVSGIARFRVLQYVQDEGGFLSARGETSVDIQPTDAIRSEALFYNLKALAREILELLPGTTEPLVELVDRIDDPVYLTNVCASYLNLSLAQKQELLEAVEVEKRLDLLLDLMRKEREVLSLQREIRDKMSERLSKAQREALLREQLRTIRNELGEEPGEEATDEMEEQIRRAHLSDEAMKQAQEELKRLRNLPPSSAEYHVIRTYLEWLLAMPWTVRSPSEIDVSRARAILDEDHYGLEKVKRRITQFLAVGKLKNNLHGPILCLVGPPGVGKTSLGQSIARALGRRFIRTSLGGVRDEAEIRGHRRTYVGALPGRIAQSIKRVGTKNPVMMLDEIDKLRADYHGDPSSAMLEVLDPEQNKSFTDHYLDVPFDLSEVFFIATANVTDTIPPALLDRMEVIEVNGYTSQEKIHIAEQYLIPKQLAEHGLTRESAVVPLETLRKVITNYTREAGVRELQRQIAALFRAAAEEIVADKPLPIQLTPDRLRPLLGTERFFPELAEENLKPGVSVGLAWTPHGGDILFVEASSHRSEKGGLILTGQLGDVMKESAQIALSLAKSRYELGNHDFHIHVPAGAIPKDGPSAGVTILTSLVSLATRRAVRPAVAMTGEVTLRGAVLPVGGIKEKVLAAHRAGIKTVILPKRNEQDLDDVPADVKQSLNFVFADRVDAVLDAAIGPMSPTQWAPRPPRAAA